MYSMLEREAGLAPIAERGRGAQVSEIDRRIERAREIVARQRGLVATYGGRRPLAAALLESYETTLAILEASRAQLAARNFQPSCLQRADTNEAPVEHQEQMKAVQQIMIILHKAGYRCELAPEQ